MWVTKLLIFPVEIRIFCPKTTKFGPKLTFLVNLGQAMQAYSVICWWVGWWLWRAGCISQDTYLLYGKLTLLGRLINSILEAIMKYAALLQNVNIMMGLVFIILITRHGEFEF